MDIQKKQISLNIPTALISTSVVIDSDAIVNDSKPDLLKIIQIDPGIKLTRVDISDGQLSVEGRITYKVIYQPENADGICSIVTGTDFSHIEENPSFSSGMYCDVSAKVEHIESRLINSRKFKIKSVAGLDMNILSCSPVTVSTDISGDNLLTKKGILVGTSRFLTKKDIIEVADSLPLAAGSPSIGTLLKTDVSLCNKDIKIISGKVIVKGEARLSTLYLPDNSKTPECCKHSMPFTEILDAEGITEEHICRVVTEIDDYDISPISDSDGDIRILNSNIRISVKTTADLPVSEEILTDVYSLSENLDVSYADSDLKPCVNSMDFDYTINHSIYPPRETTVKSVYTIGANPYITDCSISDGSLCIEGHLDLNCLFITGDSSCPIVSHTEQVPFSTQLSAEGCKPGMETSVHAELNVLNFNSGLTGETDIRAVISCNVQFINPYSISYVESVTSLGAIQRKMPSILLSFVQEGDSLWDIAKRYHTKEEYIRSLNGEACDHLVAGNQLLIPKG